MDACRSLGRLLRRMSSTPARRAVVLDEEDNWCLLSDNESDHGTPNETELANFSPAETLEEDLDPGWVADFTVAPAAEQIPSPQGRVNFSKINYNFSWDRRHVTYTTFFLIIIDLIYFTSCLMSTSRSDPLVL